MIPRDSRSQKVSASNSWQRGAAQVTPAVKGLVTSEVAKGSIFGSGRRGTPLKIAGSELYLATSVKLHLRPLTTRPRLITRKERGQQRNIRAPAPAPLD